MLRATKRVPKAELTGRIAVDSITLARADRYKRRVLMTTDRGHDFLLDLPEPAYMADGDALDLGDRGLVVVRAAPEDLLEVHAASPTELARIAWHIGNRHTPAEITAAAIYIQPDAVLADMVRGLGGHVHAVTRPFEPEGGAYGGRGPLLESHHHAHHGHRHDHGDHHHHSHEHSHANDPHAPHPARPDSHSHPSHTPKPRVWRPDE